MNVCMVVCDRNECKDNSTSTLFLEYYQSTNGNKAPAVMISICNIKLFKILIKTKCNLHDGHDMKTIG